MILILSESSDLSTNNVIEWLEFFKKRWFRINSYDEVKLKYLGKDIILEVNKISIKLSKIEGFWYRRGFIYLKGLNHTNIKEFDDLQKDEISSILEFIFYKLKKIKHINSYKNAIVNKLVINDIARDNNIITPNDYLFSDKKNLKKILKQTDVEYISKVISGQCIQQFDDLILFNYTSIIKLNKLNKEDFFPSLVQNLILKKYELRIFYLDGNFYSMAIFSQKDNQTNVDFRNYNNEKPNRTVPYKLPVIIEEKLNSLMKKLDLNCGSIDMIVTPENEYVFLEVNPVGQFGMVSYPCNYNLEKLIANYL